MKDVTFLGSSLDDIKVFPEEARQQAGYQLSKVQYGIDPDDWKPIGAVGVGVREIRIHRKNEYRVIYIAKLEDAIYVLHAFEKKTQKTEKRDIDLAKQRLKEVLK